MTLQDAYLDIYSKYFDSWSGEEGGGGGGGGEGAESYLKI